MKTDVDLTDVLDIIEEVFDKYEEGMENYLMKMNSYDAKPTFEALQEIREVRSNVLQVLSEKEWK